MHSLLRIIFFLSCIYCLTIFSDLSAQNPVVDFDSPDTVCLGAKVQIRNNTTGGTTYFWDFCSGNTLSDPVGTNIGNPGGMLSVPSYMTLVSDGNKNYSFVTSQGIRSLIRYDHGSGFQNDPVAWRNLGSFGMISDSMQGVKICNDNGTWVGFVNNNNRIIRLNFGTNLSSTPTATLLGPWPMVFSAHAIEIIRDNGQWTGFLSCSWGNKMVRLNFGNSLLNNPTLTDLGAPGGLNLPCQFRIVKENGNWYALVANYGNGTFTRLNFGASLQNQPTGDNLGPVCPGSDAVGIALIRDCGNTTGFHLNYSTTSPDLLWRLEMPEGITGPVTGRSLGNIGNLSRPNVFSELFRVGESLFLYASNRQNYTLTRFQFFPCSNASVPSSTLFNPPEYTYDQTGTFNINLTVNEGMVDQVSICKNITVIDPPAPLTRNKTLCEGDSCFLENEWRKSPGTFHDLVPGKFGCDTSVTTVLSFDPAIHVNLGPDTTICEGETILLQTGVDNAQYYWQDGSTGPTFLVVSPGSYRVLVTKLACSASDSITVGSCSSPLRFPNAFTPNGDGINDIFYPVGIGVMKFSLLIFNRWGEQVFETEDIGRGWDGRVRNSDASDGVYFFTASYEMFDQPGETFRQHGSLTLLR